MTAAGPSQFATTQWNVVLAAGRDGLPDGSAALASLCETYWPPLYAFLRRDGCSPQEAEDIVQGFFCRLLEKGDLAHVAPEGGRFRSFLRTAIKHFLLNERDRERAAKRGDQQKAVSLDVVAAEERYAAQSAAQAAPDAVFDRQWGLLLLERVRQRLAEEFAAAGKKERFDLLQPLLSTEPAGSYRQVAAALGASENAAKVAVHRLRQRFGELLREEIAQTVETPEEIDDEIRDLFDALRA
jgi:RNA polymerase sigma factor (sigma-70 family)